MFEMRSDYKASNDGFTLIEIIVVMVIAGIVSYVVVANFSNSHQKIQYMAMLDKLAADVRYARGLTMATGQATSVFIDVANNRYYLKWGDGSFIENPIGGGDFIVNLGSKDFKDVVITATGFSGGRLDFNTMAEPSNAGSPFSGSLSLVTLNNQKTLTISGESALLNVVDN